MKYIIIMWAVFFSSQLSYSQNIQLIVKKGSAFISGRLIQLGKIELIKQDDVVNVSIGSLILVSSKNEIIELKAEKEYTYKAIVTLFKKNKSFNDAFVDVIINQDFSRKKQSISTTRGFIPKSCLFNPRDSVIVLSDSITFSVGTETCILLSDLNITKKGSNDSLKLSLNDSKHKIKTPSPGEYFWSYKLKNESRVLNYKNYFIVPDISTKKSLISVYQSFQKSISGFSSEMQDQLLKEFMDFKLIYVE